MKLVVTDTNVLIDVLDCHLVQAFFDLPLEIHTTEFILAELNEIQRAALMCCSGGTTTCAKKRRNAKWRCTARFGFSRFFFTTGSQPRNKQKTTWND